MSRLGPELKDAAETMSTTPAVDDPSPGERQDRHVDSIYTYLVANCASFRSLMELKHRGWSKTEADTHFETQRNRADTANDSVGRLFFVMMRQIADELHEATGVFDFPSPQPRVLDICAAPGGFMAAVYNHRPDACVEGMTLPEQYGGHRMRTREIRGLAPVSAVDVTMLAGDFGVTRSDVPDDHPDLAKFSFEPFFLGEPPYDLVFCDGQVLHTHARQPYREKKEATRLACAQLMLALQHVAPGGTLVMLLHKVDSVHTARLLHTLDRCSRLALFKPQRRHATRSSFYAVAKDLQPQSLVALAALADWQQTWREVTVDFRWEDGARGQPAVSAASMGVEADIVSSFGERLVQLGEPVWETQRAALARAPWMQ